jgi:antitoxin MazE
MKTTIRKVGNSHGVIIPVSMLAQAGIRDEAEMQVEKGAIVLRRPRKGDRAGWAEASKQIADGAGDVDSEWT